MSTSPPKVTMQGLFSVSTPLAFTYYKDELTDLAVTPPTITTEADVGVFTFPRDTDQNIRYQVEDSAGNPLWAGTTRINTLHANQVSEIVADVETQLSGVHGAGSWATAVGFATHSAADVWAVGTRTLTSFGTLIADIWAYVTRTLTSFGSLQTDVTAILADTNEMQGKLPTNNIMGSAVKTDKDDEIDAILVDTNEMQGKLPAGTISDFDETTDPVELLDTGGTAGTSASELVDDFYEEPTAGHSTLGTFGVLFTTIPSAVWHHLTSAIILAGSIGKWILDNLDAKITTRAAPGAKMDLVADAVDSTSLAVSASQEIRDEILSDSTPFNGADVTLSKRILAHRMVHSGTTVTIYDTDDITPILTFTPKSKDGNAIDSAVYNLSTPAERTRIQ